MSQDDYLLEVGCGGGAFLSDALKSGCLAAAVDHSAEVVRLAKRSNLKVVRDGRLDVRQAKADSLPFRDSNFTCAVMTSVLGFLPDALRVFTEIKRVLTPGGRMIVFSTSKEAKGTPAAPEPMASWMHFYEDAELERMAIEAGFSEARVEGPDFSKFVKGSGIPKRDLQSFSAPIGQLLHAKKGWDSAHRSRESALEVGCTEKLIEKRLETLEQPVFTSFPGSGTMPPKWAWTLAISTAGWVCLGCKGDCSGSSST